MVNSKDFINITFNNFAKNGKNFILEIIILF